MFACLQRAIGVVVVVVLMSDLGNPAPLVQGSGGVMGFDFAHHQMARALFKSAAAVFTVSSGPLVTSAPWSITHAGAKFAAGEHTDKDSHQWTQAQREVGGAQSIGNRSAKEFLSRNPIREQNQISIFEFPHEKKNKQTSLTGVVGVRSHI